MDRLNKFITLSGKLVAWLILAMVMLSFAIVILRYGFNSGWIWLQESVTYLHAIVFMIAAAWTLQLDGHVRVDIFYRDRAPRQQAWVNIIGSLIFLLPFCIFMLVIGWQYVYSSWRLFEGSREAGGLPLVYLLKSLILLLPGLLLMQAFSGLARCINEVRGQPAGPSAAQGHHLGS